MDMDIFSATTQYGLPLVMFFGVIWLSMSGRVIWKPSHDAIVAALTARLQDVTDERDKFADIAYKGVGALEQGAEALKGSRR